jgi:hypothetical protein
VASTLFQLLSRPIYAAIPSLHQDGNPRKYRLVAIDDAGLWLESEELLDRLVRADVRPSGQERLVVFVPYAQITCLFELPEAGTLPRRPAPEARSGEKPARSASRPKRRR